MTDTKASPISGDNWRDAIKEIADIIRDSRNDVKHERDVISFLSRIVDENRIDPGSFYRCDICNHLCKGREGRELNGGVFVCGMCKIREAENSTEGET